MAGCRRCGKTLQARDTENLEFANDEWRASYCRLSCLGSATRTVQLLIVSGNVSGCAHGSGR